MRVVDCGEVNKGLYLPRTDEVPVEPKRASFLFGMHDSTDQERLWDTVNVLNIPRLTEVLEYCNFTEASFL